MIVLVNLYVCMYVCVYGFRFWRQVPGHLLSVESNSLGVVWGIGYDHTAWVYTIGHGENQAQGKTPSLTVRATIQPCLCLRQCVTFHIGGVLKSSALPLS